MKPLIKILSTTSVEANHIPMNHKATNPDGQNISPNRIHSNVMFRGGNNDRSKTGFSHSIPQTKPTHSSTVKPRNSTFITTPACTCTPIGPSATAVSDSYTRTSVPFRLTV